MQAASGCVGAMCLCSLTTTHSLHCCLVLFPTPPHPQVPLGGWRWTSCWCGCRQRSGRWRSRGGRAQLTTRRSPKQSNSQEGRSVALESLRQCWLTAATLSSPIGRVQGQAVFIRLCFSTGQAHRKASGKLIMFSRRPPQPPTHHQVGSATSDLFMRLGCLQRQRNCNYLGKPSRRCDDFKNTSSAASGLKLVNQAHLHNRST